MAYYLTVNIEAPGTSTADGKSRAGHMWYSLYNGSTDQTSNYGFTDDDTDNDGFNDVIRNDDTLYDGDPAYSKTIEITEEQYDAMKTFGDYPSKYSKKIEVIR